MIKRLQRTILLPLIMLVMLVGFAPASFAASTFMPKFQPGQNVYLDPLLEGASASPGVNLDGLEQKLDDAGRKHNIDFYFVMALKGSEAKTNQPFSQDRLDELYGKWSGSKGFNVSRSVIIYVVRLDTDWTKSSYAVNVSPGLAQEGLTGDSVFPILDRYGKNPNGGNPNALLPRAPRDFGATVAAESNALVDAFAARKAREAELAKQEAERQRLAEIQRQKDAEAARLRRIEEEKAAAERNAAIASFVKIFGGPILIAVILLFMFVRFRNAQTKARAIIKERKTKLEPAFQNYLQLEGDYLSFLQSLSDNFVGRSRQSIDQAKTAYGTLSARVRKVIETVEAAEKEIEAANMFSVGRIHAAVAKVTTEKLKVTGEDVPLAQRNLFSGVVSESTMTLEEIFAEMQALFDTAKSNCADFMQAFMGAEQNKKDIEALVGKVEALKSELAKRSLVFDPFQPRYADVSRGRDEFMSLMVSDPLTAYTKSETVERAVEAIEADMRRAIELKDSLVETERRIATAQGKVDQTRGKDADYTYVESIDTAGRPSKNLLNEKGGNPDVPLGTAREKLNNCLQLLLEGKLSEALKAKQGAETSADEAAKLIDTVLSARAFVQKEVVSVIERLRKLRDELPAADNALAALRGEFQEKNFDGEPAKVTFAHRVADTTDGELAKVKQAFAEQRYLAARAELEESGSELDMARNGLVEVASRLKKLQELRAHARATVKAAEQRANALSRKIRENSFTTSQATDDAFSAILPRVSEQRTDVGRDVTDWVAAAAQSDRLTAELTALDTAIDTQRQAYENAKRRAGEVVSKVKSAAPTFKQEYVRDAAERSYAQVVERAGQLDGALKVQKSDWNALASKVESIENSLKEAVRQANADQAAGEKARADIQSAGGTVQSIDNKSYSTSARHRGRSNSFGSGTSANVSSARSSLSRAEAEFRNGNYENASREAARAAEAAREADRIAIAAVAAAISAWESSVNSEIRRAEEAAEAAERSRRSSESSSSYGGGFSGGGGSVGSDFSGGGGSKGGGDF
ncbi:MAG: hypothetical protein K2Y32_18280 [Candidatus Obscuribacterales bacterium]|nr:hypothetical protein [Candidatus Obscuribacterales bacterium]